MWLLCLVAAAGMALAAGPTLDRYTIVATLGGGVLAIGASGTFNHVLERDVDQKMSRTADRPLANDLIPRYSRLQRRARVPWQYVWMVVQTVISLCVGSQTETI